MKLDYFDLLSPDPVYIPNTGSIISPKLSDISSIGKKVYQYYLAILTMDAKSYFETTGQAEQYEKFDEDYKMEVNIFDLLTSDEKSAQLLQSILNFFVAENVVYSINNHCFLVSKGDKIIGYINRDTYAQVCNIICQRNCIKSSQTDDLSKVKNIKALEIMKKLQKGRAEKVKHTKADKNMELGNIISAVANKSHSLNIINIWDLTIFQLWDCFSRLSTNDIHNIQSMSVAAWGNKDKTFDATTWFKLIENNN